MSTSANSVPSGLSLRANFSWIFAGNLVYAGCQWGMLVVLAKLGSPEIVGQFALGLAITAPVMMFANLQLRGVQATDARQEYLFGDYLGLRLITTVLALTIIAGIVLVAGYRWETTLVILAVGIAKAFESISDVFYGLLQQSERMDRIAKSMMIKGPLSLIALGVGVYLTGSVLWGTVGLAVAWALLLCIYDIPSGALLLRALPRTPEGAMPEKASWMAVPRPRWEIETLRKLAWLTLPLGFVTMLISLNTTIPRYFIEWYLGERELGIFAAMAHLMVGQRILVNPLGEAASPWLARYYMEGNSAAFGKLLLKLVGVGALLGGTSVLISLVAGREILTLLYRPEYAEHTNVLVWLMVAAALSYVSSPLNYGLIALRQIYWQVPINIVSMIILCGSLFTFVPTKGMLGAAIALATSFGLSVLLKAGLVEKRLRA